MQQIMGRRKRVGDDSNIDGTSSSDCMGSFGAAASVEFPGSSADEYDIWLIRKPTKVSPSRLSAIKFPHKAKDRTKTVTPIGPYAMPLNCHFNQLVVPHVFIPTVGINNLKDAIKLKAANLVKGVVLVSEKFDVFGTVSTSPNDEFSIKHRRGSPLSAPLENGMRGMDFTINSIRKKPQLPAEETKQRLKPFGIIPKKKKKKYKLPSLVTSSES